MGFKEVFAEMTELAGLVSNALCVALARYRPLTASEQAKVRGIVAACFAAHASGRLTELSDAVLRHGEREQIILRCMNDAGKN